MGDVGDFERGYRPRERPEKPYEQILACNPFIPPQNVPQVPEVHPYETGTDAEDCSFP